MRYLSYFLVAAFAMFSLVQCDDNTEESQTGRFKVTLSNTGKAYEAIKSGAFTTPVGASDPAPIGPGEFYEFSFTAPPGSRLTLATMFVQSNDWIYAMNADGIPLYNSDGSKNTGEMTSMIDLYDVGTEINEEPGIGGYQAPRQSELDSGPMDSNSNVRMISSEFPYMKDLEVKIEMVQ